VLSRARAISPHASVSEMNETGHISFCDFDDHCNGANTKRVPDGGMSLRPHKIDFLKTLKTFRADLLCVTNPKACHLDNVFGNDLGERIISIRNREIDQEGIISLAHGLQGLCIERSVSEQLMDRHLGV
jgi:hypothetical protein